MQRRCILKRRKAVPLKFLQWALFLASLYSSDVRHFCKRFLSDIINDDMNQTFHTFQHLNVIQSDSIRFAT